MTIILTQCHQGGSKFYLTCYLEPSKIDVKRTRLDSRKTMITRKNRLLFSILLVFLAQILNHSILAADSLVQVPELTFDDVINDVMVLEQPIRSFKLDNTWSCLKECMKMFPLCDAINLNPGHFVCHLFQCGDKTSLAMQTSQGWIYYGVLSDEVPIFYAYAFKGEKIMQLHDFYF